VQFYADLVGVVASGQATKMAANLSIRHSEKPHSTRKHLGSTFYRAGVIVDRFFSYFYEIWGKYEKKLFAPIEDTILRGDTSFELLTTKICQTV